MCDSVWEKVTGRTLAEGGGRFSFCLDFHPVPDLGQFRGASRAPRQPENHGAPGPPRVLGQGAGVPEVATGEASGEEAPACSPHREGSTSHRLQRRQAWGPSVSRAGAGGPGKRWVAPAAWTSPARKPGPMSAWP